MASGRDYATDWYTGRRAPPAELEPHGAVGVVHSLNHVSKESDDVERLSRFYQHFLGFRPLVRPPFPFGGTWLFLPPCTAMHLIDRDDTVARLPEAPAREVAGLEPMSNPAGYFPRGISRGHHYAFRVLDIAAAEEALQSHGVQFWTISSPPNFLRTPEGTAVKPEAGGELVSQIFFYDPDGNGVELGNFAELQPGFASPRAHLPAARVRTGPPPELARAMTAVGSGSWTSPCAVVPHRCASMRARVCFICRQISVVHGFSGGQFTSIHSTTARGRLPTSSGSAGAFEDNP